MSADETELHGEGRIWLNTDLTERGHLLWSVESNGYPDAAGKGDTRYDISCTLIIGDCNRVVELDFYVWGHKRDYMERRKKLRRMIEELEKMEAAYEAAGKRAGWE